jgi:hypothetical protein
MLCGVHFHRNESEGIRIRNDAALLSGLLGTCDMAKRRELTEQFVNGVQFGTCNACGWNYQCPPLLPNDEQSQGALDRAFDQHRCEEHVRQKKKLPRITDGTNTPKGVVR